MLGRKQGTSIIDEQKIKSVNSYENTFQFDDRSELNPTQEELIEYRNMLFSNDADMESMAINYFSQAIPFVTPEIYQRILSLKNSNDPDLIESIIDFIMKAIKSKEIQLNLLINQETATLLLTISQNVQDKSLLNSTISAITLFSKRSNEMCKIFIDQSFLPRCCQILQQSLTDISGNIQLISTCLNYINMIYLQLDEKQCDSLCNITVPLYQCLIEASKTSKPLAELTMQSLRYYIIQCSDQGLSNIFNENLYNFINLIINSSPDSILYVLNLFVAISYHNNIFFAPLLPTFGNLLQMYMNSEAKNDKLTLAFLGVIRNLSANDDQATLTFLFSQPVLVFLQSSLINQPFAISNIALHVYSYLSQSNINEFKKFIWENSPVTISSMIEYIDVKNPESVVNCFLCLRNLLLYLQKANQSSYSDCINFILTTDIEKIIGDVLDSDFDTNILELTNQLAEILCL